MQTGAVFDDYRQQFPGAPGYLNTGSMGLPPPRTVAAMQAIVDDWQNGRATAVQFDDDVARSRAAFAEMVGAPIDTVAIGPQVSALMAIAATLPDPGARVVLPEGEFTSVFFPFLARGDLDVRTVPLAELAGAIDDKTDIALFSVVQSATGEVADLESIRAAAAATGTLTVADATQAVGWLPVRATDFDVMATGAYKWMLCPRGSAFLTMRPELWDRAQPIYAGWYSGEDPWDSIYDLPFRVASNARRFDLSPAWFTWVGTRHSLEFVNEVGIDSINEHDVDLANALRAGLGLEPSNSSMVTFELPEGVDTGRLEGLVTARRAGKVRVGFHLYNSIDDVDALLGALQ